MMTRGAGLFRRWDAVLDDGSGSDVLRRARTVDFCTRSGALPLTQGNIPVADDFSAKTAQCWSSPQAIVSDPFTISAITFFFVVLVLDVVFVKLVYARLPLRIRP